MQQNGEPPRIALTRCCGLYTLVDDDDELVDYDVESASDQQQVEMTQHPEKMKRDKPGREVKVVRVVPSARMFVFALAIVVASVALTSPYWFPLVYSSYRSALKRDLAAVHVLQSFGPYSFRSCDEARQQGVTIFDGICDDPHWSNMTSNEFVLQFKTMRPLYDESAGAYMVSIKSSGLLTLHAARPSAPSNMIGNDHLMVKLFSIDKLADEFNPLEGRSAQMVLFPQPFENPSPMLVYITEHGTFHAMLPTSGLTSGAFYIASFSSSYVLAP